VAPGAKDVLEPLWRLYKDTSQGQRAVLILEQLLTHPEVKASKSEQKRIYVTIGEVTRDLVANVERAVAAFDAALDVDPQDPGPLSAIEELLTSRKKWPLLEKAYVKMIARLPNVAATHDRRMALWRALAELYKGPLRKPEDALAAYEVVASGLPMDASVQVAYAELAAKNPGSEESAMNAYRQAILSSVHPGKMCAQISKLAQKLQDSDLSFRAARAAVVLFGENDETLKLAHQKLLLKAADRASPQRPLTESGWRNHLLHPDLRGPLGDILALLHSEVGEQFAEKLSSFGINAKKHLLAADDLRQGVSVRYVTISRALGLDTVPLYSPFLAHTREKGGIWPFKTSVPDSELLLSLCYTSPLAMKAGGQYFSSPPTGTALDFSLASALVGARAELAFLN
jgi:hypothetical protein